MTRRDRRRVPWGGGDVNRQRKAQGAFPPWAHFADAPPLPRVQSDTDTITTQYTLEQFHFCNSSYQICKLLRSQCGGQTAPAGRSDRWTAGQDQQARQEEADRRTFPPSSRAEKERGPGDAPRPPNLPWWS